MTARMTRAQAVEMADEFRAIGGFTKIRVAHFGSLPVRTEAADNAQNWYVELEANNPKSGNRNYEECRSYEPKMAKAIARKAKGKATKSDLAAFARIAAERSC